MSTILNGIDPIQFSDNFKTWIIRFNDVVNELKTTDFAIRSDFEYVNRQSDELINGVKTFGNSSIFNSNVSVSGNLNVSNGSLITDNANNRLNISYSIDGSVNFIGVNGINLLSNSTANEFSLKFLTPSTENTLVLDYEAADGVLKIANNISLEIEKSEIKFGNSTWNFPVLPSQTSVLKCDGGEIQWLSQTDLADSLATDIATSVALTSAVEITPVGTIIEVDTTKAAQWSGGLAGGNIPDPDFYGWLILNGATITAPDANSEFVELIDLLQPGQTNYPKSATLSPNSTSGSPETVKLIKYKKDAVSTFALTRGNGISFFEADGITTRATANLKNGTTHIELNANSDVFGFTNGQLQLKPNVPRYDIDARLTTAQPVSDNHAANKLYVDTRIATGGVEGSCFDLMESSDNLGYSDSKNSFSIVDKRGTGRAWRTVATNTLFSGSIDADVTLNSISPFGSNFGRVTQLKRTFATPDQFFFIDEDDVIYAYGTNQRGDIGANSRGTTEFNSYYGSGFFPTNPYSNTVQARQLVPAFLPLKPNWSANAVLFDSATGMSGSNDSFSNITIKTKDGYDNRYVNPESPTSGFVSYFNSGVPYTRGYYISTGNNAYGQFGQGNLTSTSAATGPRVWGPFIDSPGRNLWYNFALTPSQKESIKTSGALTTLLNSSTTSEQIRKRFNWFKPNAITAGEWSTQTGLTDEEFSNYSWYIKKVVRTFDAHYVIVGKPGNESENEVWCAGVNRSGAFGNLRTDSSKYLSDFAPMLTTVDYFSYPTTGTFRVAGNGALNAPASTVFERSDSADLVFSDFDTLRIGTTNYYIILGNANGANRTKQFRLFSSFNGARLAFIGSNQTTDDVSLNNNTTNGIGASSIHYGRLKGIVDISVSRGTGSDTSGDGILMRRALTFDTIPNQNELLDRVPEQYILTDAIFACGLNTNGRLATNSTTNPNIPFETNFAAPGRGTNKIIKTISCNFSAISFALSSNRLLYFAGNRASGCSNSGNIIGNTTSWTNVAISNIHDFYVIDDSNRTRLFVIAETAPNSNIFELYAGGFNANYILGSSISLGAATPRFAKIIFPENPKNIVAIAGAMDQTYILCKDEGEDIGRVYVAGREVGRSYFPVATLLKTIPQFKNIDRDIL